MNNLSGNTRTIPLKTPRYKLKILTALGTLREEYSYSIQTLIELADTYTAAQSYKIYDTERVYLKTQAPYIMVSRTNLPGLLRKQAS